MLLGSFNNIDNLIVILLARKGSLSAKELFKIVNKNYKKSSIQAIYKELRKLIDEGVVWKSKDLYGLSAAWVVNFS